MHITALGAFSWLVQSGDYQIIINSNFSTLLPSFNKNQSKLNSENFIYRGTKQRYKINYNKEKTILIQCSDQYQFFSPNDINDNNISFCVSPNSIIPNIGTFFCSNLEFDKWYSIGSMNFFIFGCPLGSDDWDNLGVSVFILDTITQKTILIQGANEPYKHNMLPKHINLTIITWNSISTINTLSAYKNIYDNHEYFSIQNDAIDMLKYFNLFPPSEKVAFQGNYFYKLNNKLARKELEYYIEFIKPYLMNSECIDIKPGLTYDLEKNTLFPYCNIEPIDDYIIYPNSLNITESKCINNFLEGLSNILLLTPFGKEMFDTSNFYGNPMGSARFCVAIFHNKIILEAYVFDISNNSFQKLDNNNLTLTELACNYPYGISLEKEVLLGIENGIYSPWEVFNSDSFSQWYICSPNKSPVVALYIYYQEACHVNLITNLWKKSITYC